MAGTDRLVVEVRCVAYEAELVADHLLTLGASAVAESAPATTGSGTAVGEVLLSADLEADALDQFNWPGVEVRVVDRGSGWLDTWRDHAEPMWAGRFLVRPAWVPAGDLPTAWAEQDIHGSEPIELAVDPGHTFGSGTHESTRLCLELVGRLVRPVDTVLDVGCGSGILAVAALLAGAGHAEGVDIDPESAAVSSSVAAANGVADRYSFAGETIPGGQFDLVCANMLVNDIEDLASAISGAVRQGGIVVASGFLADQVDRVLGALAQGAGAEVVESIEEGGWCAIALRATPPNHTAPWRLAAATGPGVGGVRGIQWNAAPGADIPPGEPFLRSPGWFTER